MGMREECKHFQSRTYKSGEVARFCVLGNAPDQPWSCPENCPTYEPRYADVGWSHGSLVDRPVEPAPSSDVPIDDRRELLEMASEIVNAVAPELLEERRRELVEREKHEKRGWKFWRR
ncbi:MAG TPA: hypothetical protein VMV53_09790 [Acidimicrobiales bacterium]|nr:hypothetical protein [Acidimicrobiales bacterium]